MGYLRHGSQDQLCVRCRALKSHQVTLCYETMSYIVLLFCETLGNGGNKEVTVSPFLTMSIVRLTRYKILFQEYLKFRYFAPIARISEIALCSLSEERRSRQSL